MLGTLDCCVRARGADSSDFGIPLAGARLCGGGRGGAEMRRLIDRCAGIDVGQALLVVCVRVVDEKGKLTQEIRSFGATTPDLLELRDWLAASEVTDVA